MNPKTRVLMNQMMRRRSFWIQYARPELIRNTLKKDINRPWHKILDNGSFKMNDTRPGWKTLEHSYGFKGKVNLISLVKLIPNSGRWENDTNVTKSIDSPSLTIPVPRLLTVSEASLGSRDNRQPEGLRFSTVMAHLKAWRRTQR